MSPVQVALAICRFLHYVAAMGVFGAGVFVTAIAPPSLARDLAPALRNLVVAGAALLTLTSLMWFALESGAMGEGWADAFDIDTLVAVLTETEFGFVWMVDMILTALTLGAALFAWPRAPRLAAATSGLTLVALGFVGHSAMANGMRAWLAEAAMVAHLIAGGLWLGGLAPLLLVFRTFADPLRRIDARLALSRFSAVGHGAVALVVATGFANTTLILGHWPFDRSSPYALLLDAKIAFVAAMVALALVNRYALTPRLAATSLDAVRVLSRDTVAELILGVGVIGLVAVFGLLPPT